MSFVHPRELAACDSFSYNQKTYLSWITSRIVILLLKKGLLPWNFLSPHQDFKASAEVVTIANMVSLFDCRSRRLALSPAGDIVLCSNEQETLLSQCLCPPKCNNCYQRILGWEKPCDGLASKPEGSRKLIFLVGSCYKN